MLLRLKHAVRDQPLLRAGALRAGTLVRSVGRSPPGIYTLCYHHVAPAAQDNFARQLRFLKRFGTFIDADTALERLTTGQAGAERAFVLTFDDGYADTVEIARPVIEGERVPAMLFLVADWLDAPPADGQRYMDRAAAVRWLAAGLDIGSHSATHRRFSEMSQAEAAADLGRAADTLATLAGTPIRHFACPWGVARVDYLPGRDPDLAVAAGHRTFFTTRRGHATQAGDLLAMPRHVLEPEWPLYQLDVLMGGVRFGRA